MKKAVVFIQVLLTVIILSTFSVYADAASITDGLPLSALPLDEGNHSYRKSLSLPEGEFIVSFDVSEEMGILLVTRSENISEYHLSYLDKCGDVIAVYTFESSGTAGVAWDGADICLLFTRGHVIEKSDCGGNLKARYSLARIDYKTDKEWEALAHRKEKEVSTGTYILRAGGLAPLRSVYDYRSLVFVDRNSGCEKTIYDAGPDACVRSWLHFILPIGFFALVITMIRQHSLQIKSQEENAKK